MSWIFLRWSILLRVRQRSSDSYLGLFWWGTWCYRLGRFGGGNRDRFSGGAEATGEGAVDLAFGFVGFFAFEDVAFEDFLGEDGADLVEIDFDVRRSSRVAVARSLVLQPGDELLTTDHDYNACRNVLAEATARAGAKVVVAKVPFPLTDEQQIVDAILGAVTKKTRLAMIDHITSPTALVFPHTTGVKGYHDLTPRGGVAIDLFGTGRTSLKVNFGRYLEAAQNGGFFTALNPPGRISAKPAGSRPHSSAGQDTTALRPLTPCGLPWYIH